MLGMQHWPLLSACWVARSPWWEVHVVSMPSLHPCHMATSIHWTATGVMGREDDWQPLNRASCPPDFWESLSQWICPRRHLYGTWMSSHSTHKHPEKSIHIFLCHQSSSLILSKSPGAPIATMNCILPSAWSMRSDVLCNSTWRIILMSFRGTSE